MGMLDSDDCSWRRVAAESWSRNVARRGLKAKRTTTRYTRRKGRRRHSQKAAGRVTIDALEQLMSYRETEHLRVLIANERKDRLALVAPIVVALGHEVIAREIEVEDVGRCDRPGATRRRARRTGGELPARARTDRQDRARGRLPGDRAAARARPGVRQGGVEARRVRPHLDADVEDWQSAIESCCAASPNTMTSRGRSAAARRPSEPRAS